MQRQKSKKLFAKAKEIIPGGVNSPVRAFKNVAGEPIFFQDGSGPILQDVDGNRYIDYVGSWGPMIFGHSYKPVIKAIQKQANIAIGFGAPTELEIELAELVIERLPSIEKLRLVNSGTEATMSAIRLARGHTNRDLIIKFAGCYHGHSDGLLSDAGSGMLTLGIPNSPGIPTQVAESTLTLPFNDLTAVQQAFDLYPQDVAAVIVEPIAGNMGCIPPKEGFLQGLRELTSTNKAVLIFDEVMTGFRVSWGGAQTLYDVKPDITTLGKIIGGGLPVGAFGGSSEIMDNIAPVGEIYQAGTLSGNPLSTSAGIAMLKNLNSASYVTLTELTGYLCSELQQIADNHEINITINRACGMFSIFFSDGPIEQYSDVMKSDTALFNSFFHSMLNQGIYLAPSPFESGFISLSHNKEILKETLRAAKTAFAGLVKLQKAT